jgi:hypothetical protein
MAGDRKTTEWRGCALALVALLAASISAAQSTAAQTLDQDIVRLLDSDPEPRVALDPRRRFLLLVHQRQLIARERLAEPTIELAGRRVNTRTGALHTPIEYYALTLVELATGERSEIVLPRNSTIGFPAWAPDGSRFALVVHGNGGLGALRSELRAFVRAKKWNTDLRRCDGCKTDLFFNVEGSICRG